MSFDLAGYEPVAARQARFFDKYPDGSIQCSTPEVLQRPDDSHVIAVTATVWRTPDDGRPGIASSQEPYPGKTPYTRQSEAENAETSAIGRAINCVLAGLPGKGGASAEEVGARHDDPRATEPHPLSERVQTVVAGLKALDTLQREEIKEWADGRSLSGSHLLDDEEWLEQVETWIDFREARALSSKGGD